MGEGSWVWWFRGRGGGGQGKLGKGWGGGGGVQRKRDTDGLSFGESIVCTENQSLHLGDQQDDKDFFLQAEINTFAYSTTTKKRKKTTTTTKQTTTPKQVPYTGVAFTKGLFSAGIAQLLRQQKSYSAGDT